MDFDSHNVVPSASAQVVTLTMAQAQMMPTIMPISVLPGEKLEKFLTKDASKLKVDENDIIVINAIDSLKHLDFLCKNYVLNGLTDSVYNVHYTKSSANELWESLDQKYNPEDARAKNFFVGRFLDYKMVDWNIMISQV